MNILINISTDEALLEQMKYERNLVLEYADLLEDLAIELDVELVEAINDINDLEDELVDAYADIEALQLVNKRWKSRYENLLAQFNRFMYGAR